MEFFQKETITAFEAKDIAQWISFGPVIFQTARVLRNSGILQMIEDSGKIGLTIDEIHRQTNISVYGVRVLLESALGTGLVLVNNERFTITKVSYFILHDELTKVNMDFVQDVYYKGLFSLDKSIESGKPEGLKEFGEWNTVYEALSQLPEQVQKSWFNFDHFFSDDAFPFVLPMVYKNGIKKLLDIGGNTGKWAIASAQFSNEIKISILDLPGQLNVAKKNIAELGLSERINFLEGNMLDKLQKIPTGFDAIWMSQFLDCFSEKQIVDILKKCYDALDENGVVFILEPFWDRQKFKTAAFCLQQTSLYFTCVANGNSQMYSFATFSKCISAAGFIVEEQQDGIGVSQTLLKCTKILNPKL